MWWLVSPRHPPPPRRRRQQQQQHGYCHPKDDTISLYCSTDMIPIAAVGAPFKASILLHGFHLHLVHIIAVLHIPIVTNFIHLHEDNFNDTIHKCTMPFITYGRRLLLIGKIPRKKPCAMAAMLMMTTITTTTTILFFVGLSRGGFDDGNSMPFLDLFFSRVFQERETTDS